MLHIRKVMSHSECIYFGARMSSLALYSEWNSTLRKHEQKHWFWCVLCPLTISPNSQLMVGCDSRLGKFWSIFSVSYEFNSSLNRTGPYVEFLLQNFKESEFYIVVEILHFCFTHIMGVIRWNRIYC